MNCKNCNKELIEGLMELDPTIARDSKTIIKCTNCNTIIENYFMVIKDFSKNNPKKNFKVIVKLVNLMEAK